MGEKKTEQRITKVPLPGTHYKITHEQNTIYMAIPFSTKINIQ